MIYKNSKHKDYGFCKTQFDDESDDKRKQLKYPVYKLIC